MVNTYFKNNFFYVFEHIRVLKKKKDFISYFFLSWQ